MDKCEAEVQVSIPLFSIKILFPKYASWFNLFQLNIYILIYKLTRRRSIHLNFQLFTRSSSVFDTNIKMPFITLHLLILNCIRHKRSHCTHRIFLFIVHFIINYPIRFIVFITEKLGFICWLNRPRNKCIVIRSKCSIVFRTVK